MKNFQPFPQDAALTSPVEPSHETFLDAANDLNEALSHQRPDDVLGEWSNLPPEQWNIHQRIAEKTGGWLTAANIVSALGAAATVKGGVEFARGNKAKALVYVGAGRALDLVDGYVSKALGTRGRTGALVDAGIDKVLTVAAAAELTATRTISPVYAAATLAQQGRIFAHNAAIEKAGGNPNPSKAGKHSMFAIWAGVGARVAESMFQAKHPRIAKVAGHAATTAEFSSIALTEQAISGYKEQRKSLTSKKKTV